MSSRERKRRKENDREGADEVDADAGSGAAGEQRGGDGRTQIGDWWLIVGTGHAGGVTMTPDEQHVLAYRCPSNDNVCTGRS